MPGFVVFSVDQTNTNSKHDFAERHDLAKTGWGRVTGERRGGGEEGERDCRRGRERTNERTNGLLN